MGAGSHLSDDGDSRWNGGSGQFTAGVCRQLGEQAADASRHQAEAAGARRLAAASEQAVRGERQAADALRQQLQEATASLGHLRDIEVTAHWPTLLCATPRCGAGSVPGVSRVLTNVLLLKLAVTV
jgi:hypothetical protein